MEHVDLDVDPKSKCLAKIAREQLRKESYHLSPCKYIPANPSLEQLKKFVQLSLNRPLSHPKRRSHFLTSKSRLKSLTRNFAAAVTNLAQETRQQDENDDRRHRIRKNFVAIFIRI